MESVCIEDTYVTKSDGWSFYDLAYLSSREPSFEKMFNLSSVDADPLADSLIPHSPIFRLLLKDSLHLNLQVCL